MGKKSHSLDPSWINISYATPKKSTSLFKPLES